MLTRKALCKLGRGMMEGLAVLSSPPVFLLPSFSSLLPRTLVQPCPLSRPLPFGVLPGGFWHGDNPWLRVKLWERGSEEGVDRCHQVISGRKVGTGAPLLTLLPPILCCSHNGGHAKPEPCLHHHHPQFSPSPGSPFLCGLWCTAEPSHR